MSNVLKLMVLWRTFWRFSLFVEPTCFLFCLLLFFRSEKESRARTMGFGP